MVNLNRVTASTPDCPVLPYCFSQGPCATVFMYASEKTEGSYSARVYMQGDVSTGDDCNASPCGVSTRTFQVGSVPADWTGYTRIAVDFQEAAYGTDNLSVYMDIIEGAKMVRTPLGLTPSGGWKTLNVAVQDLVNQGLDITSIDQVALIVGDVSSPDKCTTAFIDNLRLEQDIAPTPPSGLSAKATGNTGEVSVTWTAGSGGDFAIAQYWLYRCTSAIATLGGLAPIKLGIVTSHLDTGRTDGTAYFYKVVAVDTVGNMSTYADGITEIDYAVPYCAPSTPAAVAIAAVDRMRVGWSGGGGATSFQIYRKAGSASVCGDLSLYYTVPSTSAYYDDFTVTITGAGTYCYAVVAVKGACSSACSNVTCGNWPGTGPVPCAPPGPIMTFNVAVSGTRTDLTWDAPAPADSALDYYEVYRSNSTGVQPVIGNLLAKIDHTGSPSYAYQNNGLEPATQYCYLIETTAENGCTNYSSEVCVTSGCNLQPPSGISGKAYSCLVRLNWDSISATEFVIYRDNGTSSCPALSNPAYQLAVVPGASAYYDDKTVVAGNTYYYVVTAKSPSCESTCSSVSTVVFDGTGETCPPPIMCEPPGFFGTVNGNAGTTRVTLSWDKPADGGSAISRYVIWASTFSTGGQAFKEQWAGCAMCATVYDSGVGAPLTATITGLQKDKQYCFVVEALDSNSPSCTRWSDEVCFTTACINPGPVSSISNRALAPNSVAVAWAAPSWTEAAIADYTIYRSTCASCAISSTVGTVSDTGALGYSLTASGLALPLEYCFTVKAEDINGCTNVSAASCHTCSQTILSAPLVTATDYLTAVPKVRVEWAMVTPGEVEITTYAIYRATMSGAVQTKVGSLVTTPGAISFSYTDAGMDVSRNYCYQVWAIDGIGCTSYSSETCLASGSSVLSMPSLTVTEYTVSPPSRIRLDWSVVTPGTDQLTKFMVYRSTCSGCSQAWVDGIAYEVGRTTFSCTDSGIVIGRSYCYEVRAIDARGATTYSGVLSCPCEPSYVLTDQTLAVNPSAGQVLVAWNRPGAGSGFSRYRIYRSTYDFGVCDDGDAAAMVAVVYEDGGSGPYAFSFTDTGVSPSLDYWYAVEAITRSNCSDIFSCGSTKAVGQCGFASGPSYTVLPSSVVIQWSVAGSTSTPVNSYELYRGEVPSGGTAGKTLLRAPGKDDVRYVDEGLAAGRTYCYVMVIHTADCTYTSPEICVDTVKFTAYPNPASLSKGPILFDGLEPGGSVEVYTINADRVVSYVSPNGGLWSWDGRNSSGSPVSSGIYLYVVKQKSGTIRGKVVIVR